MQYLNRKTNWSIRWDGKDTAMRNHWIAFGSNYEEIWRITVEKGVNHFEDEESYMLSKIGKTSDDYWNGDDFLEEEYENDLSKVEMTDEDYRNLIISSIGNAYYSAFTIEE